MIVWLGQTVSLIGSSMTGFAFTIWVWERTGQATALALFGFFILLPQVAIAPIAGAIADRWSRKQLMVAGDAVSGLLTVTVLLLYLADSLQLWHLYLAVAIKGTFEQFQELAYSASISTMVSKEQYGRASSMGFLANSGSSIIAPALAGFLYVAIGLVGILTIDLMTFAIAAIAVLRTDFPQRAIAPANRQIHTSMKQELGFGWRYITARPSLLAMLVLASLFWFAYDLGDALYAPMILSRTGNDARVLGSLASAAGIGGIVGALLASSWCGFKHRIQGVLLGIVGVGLSKTVFGLSHTSLVWIPAIFCSSLNFPLLGSSSDAIWLSKVRPEIQGRVFATRSMLMLGASVVAYSIAGPLADYIFEPAMRQGGSFAPIFGGIFGTGKGAGISLLYVICAIGLLFIGLFGYLFRVLRDIEIILPDGDIEPD